MGKLPSTIPAFPAAKLQGGKKPQRPADPKPERVLGSAAVSTAVGISPTEFVGLTDHEQVCVLPPKKWTPDKTVYL
jgi:hypothetical protein